MSGSRKSDFRIMGVDPGTKRFGLAVSDPLLVTAQGLETFEAERDVDFIEHLRGLIELYGVGIVVLGLPLSMSGGDIEGTERSRGLAGRIRKECGVEVELRDERMTSLEAERVLAQGGRISAAGDVDRLAAVLLLQGYLDERER
jgi:putative Holliday junction resolvase